MEFSHYYYLDRDFDIIIAAVSIAAVSVQVISWISIPKWRNITNFALINMCMGFVMSFVVILVLLLPGYAAYLITPKVREDILLAPYAGLVVYSISKYQEMCPDYTIRVQSKLRSWILTWSVPIILSVLHVLFFTYIDHFYCRGSYGCFYRLNIMKVESTVSKSVKCVYLLLLLCITIYAYMKVLGLVKHSQDKHNKQSLDKVFLICFIVIGYRVLKAATEFLRLDNFYIASLYLHGSIDFVINLILCLLFLMSERNWELWRHRNQTNKVDTSTENDKKILLD